ncbi:acetylornithine deacetylase/succinyl-diaminopimelate desuccinylase family protein [Jannaschia sp. Os4]|uniref:acetylornithine deacetylase/succinyl-diaminopimelate desuccinylase family protein n=1 Tax=Jannaschia sp. Os4 TaxID=2807617 RepID=UPI00193AA386|nr:acetylornithine deacetylase/succinyl-diaminopimelate desuccinylase family protein [Jannaschia sp. Os4]MBM2577327.1 acetylornithine deacetylase/succinyl-diaminopimelate desuccinylase family protein [Jannaschia sp. Os4]
MNSLLTEIEAREDECAALCAEMVRMPTLNPPGLHYRDICEWAGGRYRRLGWDVEMIRALGAPGDSEDFPRWNVLVRHEAGPGPVLHLNGHHDVVAVGDGWTRDPFGGEIDGGRVWGRGTCDMKGGIASAMIAAETLARYMTHGAVELSLTADEESGGYGGVAHLAQLGRYERVDHVIIPEPLDPGRICLGHRGVWWAEIETKGRIAHGSMPFLGDCAVRHMGAVLDEMEATLFPLLEGRRTPEPVVPEGARASTLNLNAVHGGEPVQPEGYDGLPSACVPDRCVLTIDRRFLPEEELSAVKAEVAQLMERVRAKRPDFRYEIRDLFEVHPSRTPDDAPVVAAVRGAVDEVLGREAEHVLSPGTYDQKHIDRIGRLKDCIAYGPGHLELAHQPDEWVGVRDMTQAAQVIALAGWRLLRG